MEQISNILQVIGSRRGLIGGGGAILWAMDWLSWQNTFLILALIVMINTFPILFYQEPQHQRDSITDSEQLSFQTEQHLLSKFKNYLNYFFENKKLRAWFWVLCTIKIVDGFAGPITKPLLVDLGLSLSQIGIYITMIGAFAALIGAAIAGWFLKSMSRSRALIVFAVLKLISLSGFLCLAILHQHEITIAPWIIYVINALEDLFAAMLLVVILTLVMQYSRKASAGTDFTFQVSVMATVSGVLYTVSGVIGDFLGYTSFLSLILVIGVICLVPLLVWMKSPQVENPR